MRVLKKLAFALIAATLAAPASAQYAAPVTQVSDARADGLRIATAIVVAEIIDINLETREATLRNDLGEEVTIVAPEIVTRLEDYTVGDMLIVEYLSSMAGEVREPTEEELANPWVEITEDAISFDVTHPSIGSARQFRSVATIKDLDREARTAVIEDARGRSHTIRDVKTEKFNDVSVGDVGIVVFTEAVAISVQRHGDQDKQR
jgi:hypothetical protein